MKLKPSDFKVGELYIPTKDATYLSKHYIGKAVAVIQEGKSKHYFWDMYSNELWIRFERFNCRAKDLQKATKLHRALS